MRVDTRVRHERLRIFAYVLDAHFFADRNASPQRRHRLIYIYPELF
jgi:hypothetical protein